MKPWIRRTLIGVLGTTVLLGGLSACGHGPGSHRGGWSAMSEADTAQLRERFIERTSRELKLDAAQQAKLGTLADAVKAQRDALRGPGAASAKAELTAILAGAQFDRARAQGLVEAKTGAVRDKAPAVVNAAADFFDSLKPEQQQQVRDFMAKRGGQRWGRG